MKFGKWLRCAAAATVAGCMMLSMTMPALAGTWNLSNGMIEVKRESADGAQSVRQGGQFGEWKVDEEPVITGSADYHKQLTFTALNGATVKATLQDVKMEVNASSYPIRLEGDVVLTLQGENEFTKANGELVMRDTNNAASLKLKGDGSLLLQGTSANAIDIDNVMLESGIVTVCGAIKTNALAVKKNASLTVQKTADAPQKWIYNANGEELQFAADGEDQGTITYKNTDGSVDHKIPEDPAETYDIWVQLQDSEMVQLDSNHKTIALVENDPATFAYEPGNNTLTVSTEDAGIAGPVNIKIGETAGNVDVIVKNSVAPTYDSSTGTIDTGTVLKIEGAHNVTMLGGGKTEIDCSGDVTITGSIESDLTVTGAKDVTVTGGYSGSTAVIYGKATIKCSGTLEIENTGGGNAFNELSFTQSNHKYCLLWSEDSKANATEDAAQQIGSSYQADSTQAKKYLKIMPDETRVPVDDTPAITAPAADAGGAVAAVAIGSAAVWGGYEAATRIILNKLLPEGAAIPKTQAQLAVLLWNTAGQPEPANAPAFADVADTDLAKAAQWAVEQGLLQTRSGNRFAPNSRITKLKVIRAWNTAFPKNN